MYQGKTLLVVLDWTGIVVNGLVAFVLPLVLATRAFDRMMRDYNRRLKLARLEKLGVIDLSEAAVDAVLTGFDFPSTSRIGEALRESHSVELSSSSSSSSAPRSLSTAARSMQNSRTDGGMGYGAVTTADAEGRPQSGNPRSSTSYATKALKAVLLFPRHVYKSFGGKQQSSSGHKSQHHHNHHQQQQQHHHHHHQQQKKQHTEHGNKYHAVVGNNPDTEIGGDDTKFTLLVPPRPQSQSPATTAAIAGSEATDEHGPAKVLGEDRYNDFDDYSEEDAVEEQYGVEAEDKDAQALDNVNVLIPRTSESNPTTSSKTAAKNSNESKLSSMPSSGKPVPSRLAYNAQKYLSSPSGASVREQQQEALQRFAVFAHKKLPYNYNIVQPLPSSLEPYRRVFLVATTWMFIIIIAVTMTEKIIVGCLSPDDR